MPDVSAAIEKMGSRSAPMSLADSDRFVVSEAEKWSRSVRLRARRSSNQTFT